MCAKHLDFGREGEACAEALLSAKGYVVVARNFSTRGGEVDLICRDGDTLVFVEVKARQAGSLARPDEAVTPAKRRKLVRAASAYLSEQDLWDRPCRFDVVAVVSTAGRLTATHLPDAFSLEDAGPAGQLYQPW
ncbi:YraN family protein [Desulfovibrio sp. TomC]|uniref:YraN family protein n=1 Tax=Desulfovibrio sp. TomC TaxID=1562888 RepID=UPI0005742490|nr:YraN family protein [Desulfovibrio sp. TomC]KHK00602.1 putative endonuclease [Desulfovibrio sp. TomC]